MDLLFIIFKKLVDILGDGAVRAISASNPDERDALKIFRGLRDLDDKLGELINVFDDLAGRLSDDPESCWADPNVHWEKQYEALLITMNQALETVCTAFESIGHKIEIYGSYEDWVRIHRFLFEHELLAMHVLADGKIYELSSEHGMKPVVIALRNECRQMRALIAKFIRDNYPAMRTK